MWIQQKHSSILLSYIFRVMNVFVYPKTRETLPFINLCRYGEEKITSTKMHVPMKGSKLFFLFNDQQFLYSIRHQFHASAISCVVINVYILFIVLYLLLLFYGFFRNSLGRKCVRCVRCVVMKKNNQWIWKII